MEQNLIVYTDDQLRDQVDLVVNIGKKTIEHSLKLGEMLSYRRGITPHGEWDNYCEWLEITTQWALILIKANNNRQLYVDGDSVEALANRKSLSISNEQKQPKMKRQDWFDKNIEDKDQRFLFREWVRLCKKTEKELGIMHISRFNKLMESGVNHTNYKELWNQSK